ncbi:MAG: hypothetical protein KDB24_07460 [Microthrixaceae bacterium]|nr:hypothetical protein [Microthrixaceae bacterium]
MSWIRSLPTTLPEHPLADLAHLLRRQRTPQVLMAIALAATSVGLVLRSEARAVAAETRWGERSTVVVAATDLPAGTPLDPGRVRLRQLPEATLADDVLDEATWVRLTGEGVAPTLDRNVARDEPVRAGALVGDGAPGAGADSVVAFPAGTLAPRLEPGDRVRVVAGNTLGDDFVSTRIGSAARGVVVGPPPGDLDDGTTGAGPGLPAGSDGWIAWVAVPPADADEVARIALSGSVALVLDAP